MRRLTGNQRYQQAIKKARIISQRNLRLFLADKIEILPCSRDIETACIIAEIDRLVRHRALTESK